jgi:hypothetical protein
MNVGPLLARLHDAETALGNEYRAVGDQHAGDHDVYHQFHTFSEQCDRHAEKVAPLAESYGGRIGDGADASFWSGVAETLSRGSASEDGLVLLRDLRRLYLSAEEVSITWVMAGQAAQALRDRNLLAVVRECHVETELQVKWLTTRIKVASPQALVVG